MLAQHHLLLAAERRPETRTAMVKNAAARSTMAMSATAKSATLPLEMVPRWMLFVEGSAAVLSVAWAIGPLPRCSHQRSCQHGLRHQR
jgi:hypothetical protein